MGDPSPDQIARRFQRLSQADRRAIVGRCWSAMGYAVDSDDDVLIAQSETETIRIAVVGRWPLGTSPVDIVIPRIDSRLARWNARRRGARYLDPETFARRLKYGLPNATGDRIIERYVSEPGPWPRPRLAPVVLVGLLALVMLTIVVGILPETGDRFPEEFDQSDGDPATTGPAPPLEFDEPEIRSTNDNGLPPGLGPQGVRSPGILITAHEHLIGDSSRKLSITYTGPGNVSQFMNAQEYAYTIEMASRSNYRSSTERRYFDAERNETVHVISEEFREAGTSWYRTIRSSETGEIENRSWQGTSTPLREIDPAAHLLYITLDGANTEVATVERWNDTIRVTDLDGRLRGLYSAATEPELDRISSTDETRYRITVWDETLSCCPEMNGYRAVVYLTGDGRLISLMITELRSETEQPSTITVEYESVGSIDAVSRPAWVTQGEYIDQADDPESEETTESAAVMTRTNGSSFDVRPLHSR